MSSKLLGTCVVMVLVLYTLYVVLVPRRSDETIQAPKPILVSVDLHDYVVDTTIKPLEGIHYDSCSNPIHWSHIISDTSWYWKVREEAKKGLSSKR